MLLPKQPGLNSESLFIFSELPTLKSLQFQLALNLVFAFTGLNLLEISSSLSSILWILLRVFSPTSRFFFISYLNSYSNIKFSFNKPLLICRECRIFLSGMICPVSVLKWDFFSLKICSDSYYPLLDDLTFVRRSEISSSPCVLHFLVYFLNLSWVFCRWSACKGSGVLASVWRKSNRTSIFLSKLRHYSASIGWVMFLLCCLNSSSWLTDILEGIFTLFTSGLGLAS